VNVDGFKLIDKEYHNDNKQLKYIRKNRNPSNQIKSQCDFIDRGVDLNRNYGYKFAESDLGSSSKPCDEDYRGPSPFSEPETQAVKLLVEKMAGSIKMAFNFHAFGNLFIHPFNFDMTVNDYMNNHFPDFTLIYDELWLESGMPRGSI